MKGVFFVHSRGMNEEGRLTRQEILQMSSDGMSIESHTLTHPKLIQLSDDQARSEITDSMHELALLTGRPVHFFAYPFGSYSNRELELVKLAGYHGAVTVERGISLKEYWPYELPRVMMSYHQDLGCFRKVLEGQSCD
jgi:peptidoglycan/xylan/chitin deacetylase (PgdA/CDA1 family)